MPLLRLLFAARDRPGDGPVHGLPGGPHPPRGGADRQARGDPVRRRGNAQPAGTPAPVPHPQGGAGGVFHRSGRRNHRGGEPRRRPFRLFPGGSGRGGQPRVARPAVGGRRGAAPARAAAHRGGRRPDRAGRARSGLPKYLARPDARRAGADAAEPEAIGGVLRGPRRGARFGLSAAD